MQDSAESASTAEGASARPAAARAAAWVSQGFEVLQGDLDALERARADGTHFDVLIVGSGYGGAVAADRLAGLERADGAPLSVAVLERGREYLPGAFPSTFAELAGHARFTLPHGGRARGRLEGLFDLRIGPDVTVVVANGVGGGSLINAGVMLFPDDETWADPAWPSTLDRCDLARRATRLKAELGASNDGVVNTWPPAGMPAAPRPRAMRALMGSCDRADPAPITIATTPGQHSCAGVTLKPCIACGDCVTGCNHGAKVSLDVGLLRRAQQRGARIVAGATVASLRQVHGSRAWEVDVWHTDLAMRRRMAGPVTVRAHRLILAAGTMGSTELLLRSRSDSLPLSRLLGRRFSGNGDVLAAIYDATVPLHATGDECVRPSQRQIGPTITTTLSLCEASAASRPACVVQDLAVPAALKRVMEEVTTTAALLQTLALGTEGRHEPDVKGVDPMAVDSAKQRRSTVVALFTDDTADGVMHPEEPAPATGIDADLWLDPGVRIDWPQARDDPRIVTCQRLLQQRMASSIGGRLLPNPAWQPLPAAVTGLTGPVRGPLVSVHPLGGCVMGTTREDGVVDDLGRVFDADPRRSPTDVHEGLYVLDGAIVPRALGVNPALTIAALADRAMEGLIAQWRGEQWLAPAPSTDAPQADVQPQTRPVFIRDNDVARPGVRTEVQIIERLRGDVELEGRRWHAELSLAYEPAELPGRDAPLRGWSLQVHADPRLSRLRLFPSAPERSDGARVRPLEPSDAMPAAGGRFEDAADDEALCTLPVVAGTLRVLHREATSAAQRRWNALRAWWLNRGARDLWQGLVDWLHGGPAPAMAGFFSLLDRAGEVRRFDYALELAVSGEAAQRLRERGLPATEGVWTLRGHKRLTYARRSSPWRQMMLMTLDALGPVRLGASRALDVDPLYFAMLRQPLLRLTRQQDLPTAYADLGSFALYLVRVLVSIHLWSLRKPDSPAPCTARLTPQRLPGSLPGLPRPSMHELAPCDGKGGTLRLTRYPIAQRDPNRPPVLLIHGYSASGTTFAHPCLAPSLAQALWHAGREPWVLDLRTSAALPTSGARWRFEDIAEGDIPLAVEFVSRRSGSERIDVVSHCMGSAMLAMAVLGPDVVASRVVRRIRRWVMSQITPAMRFSAANMLRAYLLNYAVHLLPRLTYPIGRAEAAPGAAWFDRLLSTLPYLDDDDGSEFDIENPPWYLFWRRTPWVRTRHRLDALFGRVFDSRRVPRAVLERIDDFFGEIDLGTAAQTLLFARHGFVGDWCGGPPAYRERAELDGGRARLPMEILTLHSRDNGLAHWSTALEVQALAAQGVWPHVRWRHLIVERAGHQDVFIGDAAADVGAAIVDFLAEPQGTP